MFSKGISVFFLFLFCNIIAVIICSKLLIYSLFHLIRFFLLIHQTDCDEFCCRCPSQVWKNETFYHKICVLIFTSGNSKCSTHFSTLWSQKALQHTGPDCAPTVAPPLAGSFLFEFLMLRSAHFSSEQEGRCRGWAKVPGWAWFYGLLGSVAAVCVLENGMLMLMKGTLGQKVFSGQGVCPAAWPCTAWLHLLFPCR